MTNASSPLNSCFGHAYSTFLGSLQIVFERRRPVRGSKSAPILMFPFRDILRSGTLIGYWIIQCTMSGERNVMFFTEAVIPKFLLALVFDWL